MSLTAENVVQKGNSLKLELHYRYASDFAILKSPEYIINSLVAFKAMMILSKSQTAMFFVTFEAKRNIGELKYSLNYSHKLNNFEKNFISCDIKDSNSWKLVSDSQLYECVFYISVKLSVSARTNPYESINNDTEFTDFELRGVDGSVQLHRIVAAAFSPVMKTAFTGDWGKKAECVIKAPPNTTKETLQHLKDYIYLDTVPETVSDLKQLSLLASLYKMPDLELRCAIVLLTDATSEVGFELFEFAMKHQMSQLVVEIMYRVELGHFKADALRQRLDWGKKAECVVKARPNTTKETLQHLKDYIFLDTVPETVSDLKQLSLLASLYIMPDLELRCAIVLLTDATSEVGYELFEFAMKHQMSQLVVEIMYRVELGHFKADALRQRLKC